jgi:hypothetical protein
LALKRRIDASNQERTDMVEYIDGYFCKIQRCKSKDNAKINSESPAWAFDRLSILALKIYHMKKRLVLQLLRSIESQAKLNILLEQRTDLSTAIDDY